MAELLFELLGALLEILLEFAAEEFIAFLWRAAAHAVEDLPLNNPVLATVGYLVLGTITGGLSLLLFPHPPVRPSKMHGISLMISPLITGSLMSMVGYTLRRSGKQAAQIESFGYGFAFALGMAVIRFCFTR
jgi:hypothetical protein